ncbi:hypothetical protein VNI00_009264 [Paramarasmius palmivorus]|uniref:Uncharacterized protein n=1 Tax=Paramarasmius palmivorus TaxID=297713 RepID=A0AAW0CRP1_9AGAR
MSLTDHEHQLLRAFHLPVLQEFFNRAVEAYPRTPGGTLGTILNTTEKEALQMEMVALHMIASFPMNFQRTSPREPLLTGRFRRNVQLVVDTFLSHLTNEDSRARLRPCMACPGGYDAPERDLSSTTNPQLWATQFIRLVGKVQLSDHASFDRDSNDCHLYTVRYMCTDLATLLSVEVGPNLPLVSLVTSPEVLRDQ